MISVYSLTTRGLSLLGTINDYISYSYEKCFSDAGEFSMLFPYSEEIFNLLNRAYKKNKIVQVDNFVGIVYKITVKKQIQTKRISIKGKHISNILTHYNYWDGSFGTIGVINNQIDFDINTRFNYAHSVFTGESPYHLPSFITFDIDKYTDKQSELYLEVCKPNSHTWFGYFQTACMLLNIGFDVVITEDNLLEVVFVFPEEREGVIFHSQIQNFLESEYINNAQNMYTLCQVVLKNISYVDEQGTTHTTLGATARQPDIAVLENKDAVLKAYIMDVDGSSLEYGSEGAYRNYATGLAQSFLTSHRLVDSFTTDIDLLDTKYTLGTDYNLGDTVTLVDVDIAISVQAQLTGYTKSSSSNGKLQIKPVFGYDQATLTQILSRNQII